MTTINLHQDQQEEQKIFSYRNANGGFFFSLGILIVTVLAFIGLRVYTSMLEKQNNQLQEEIAQKNNGLVGLDSLDKIIDMQTRVEQIKSNLQIKNNAVSRLQMTEVLDHLGQDANFGTVVSSYKYDSSGKISVAFETSNFNDAARQILNFKSSDYFANANLTKISREEKAISCAVDMNIKKQ